MKGLRVGLGIMVVFTLIVGPVSAAPATKGDSVGGVGYRLVDGERRVAYSISARGGANGPTGSFLYRSVTFSLTFGGPVTCLDIDGNEAAIGGRITHVQSFGHENDFLLGLNYLVFVQDNGSGSLGSVGPDVVSQAYILPGDPVDVPADFPATCPDAASTDHDAYDVEGDFAVADR